MSEGFLEKAINNLYNSSRKILLTATAGALFTATGCTFVQDYVFGIETKWGNQGSSLIEKEEGQEKFFKNLKEKDIQNIAELVLKDYDYLGERCGNGISDETGISLEDTTNEDRTEKQIARSLGKEKIPKEKLEKLKDFYESEKGIYERENDSILISEINKRLENKKSFLDEKSLKEMIESRAEMSCMSKLIPYLNPFKKYDFIFHIHPYIKNNKMSKPDLRVEKWANKPQFVFTYDLKGNIEILYSEKDKTLKKKFKIKDENLVYKLDMLCARNLARRSFLMIDEEKEKKEITVGHIKVIRTPDVYSIELNKALEILQNHKDKSEDPIYKSVLNQVTEKCFRIIDYVKGKEKYLSSDAEKEIFKIKIDYIPNLKKLKGFNSENQKRIEDYFENNYVTMEQLEKDCKKHGIIPPPKYDPNWEENLKKEMEKTDEKPKENKKFEIDKYIPNQKYEKIIQYSGTAIGITIFAMIGLLGLAAYRSRHKKN